MCYINWQGCPNSLTRVWPSDLFSVGVRLPKGPITLNMAVWLHSVAHGNSWQRSGSLSQGKEERREKRTAGPKAQQRPTQRWRRWHHVKMSLWQSLRVTSLFWGKYLPSSLLHSYLWFIWMIHYFFHPPSRSIVNINSHQNWLKTRQSPHRHLNILHI